MWYGFATSSAKAEAESFNNKLTASNNSAVITNHVITANVSEKRLNNPRADERAVVDAFRKVPTSVLAELYSKGISSTRLAEMYGVAGSSVRSRLNRWKERNK